MRHGPNVWVVCYRGQFTVKEQGHRARLIGGRTQREVIHFGRRRAKWNKSELIIQGRNGRIRSKDSHGFDKFPPRG